MPERVCKGLRDASDRAERHKSCPLLLQMHHLLNNGAEVNQRDEKGMTPLHRAAFLAQYDGYLELYEYLLVSCERPPKCRQMFLAASP